MTWDKLCETGQEGAGHQVLANGGGGQGEAWGIEEAPCEMHSLSA
jgi:hypothetical protein